MGQAKMITIVIDTNVVISALLFGGAPGKLIELWKKGLIKPLLSAEIMTEYLRVLAYPKFSLSEEDINYIINQEILPFFKVVKSVPGPPIIKKDPDDDKFIQCAQAGKANIIISGDSHLLALKTYHGISILTPAQFLEITAENQID
jgi:putative PIN family toxin of toxin-antitoxin system